MSNATVIEPLPGTPESAPATTEGDPPAASPEAGADSVAAVPKPPRARDWAKAAQAGYEARALKRQNAELQGRMQQEAQARAQQTAIVADLQAKYDALMGRVKTEALAVAVEQGGDVNANITGYIEKTAPERKIEALEKAMAEREARDRQREQEWIRQREQENVQQMQRAEQAALQSFVSTVSAATKQYPHLNAEFEAHEISGHAAHISQWAKTQGHTYSFEEVANFLERQAKLVHDSREQRRKSLLTPPAEGDSGSGPREPNGQFKTNGSQRTSPKPAERKQLSRVLTRDQETEQDLAAIRLAMAKDAVSKAPEKK